VDKGSWQLIATDAVGTPWLHVGDGALQPLDLTVWGRAPGGQAGHTALRFAGQRHDRETGLVYHHHRYYVPEIAQFMTPDPLLGEGSFQDVGFVPNPTGYLDPLGLVIVVGMMQAAAEKDEELKKAVAARRKVTGQDVVYLDTFKADVLKKFPPDEPVEIIGHGALGRVTFAGTGRGGREMAGYLKTAGIRPGQPIYVVVCGGAKKGPGSGGEVFVDELHQGLDGQNPVYGVGPRNDKEDDQAAVFVSPSVPDDVAKNNGMKVDEEKKTVVYSKKEYPEGSAIMIQGQWYKAEGGNPAAPTNPPF
jgi:RHS repeat-associated protein